MTSILAVDDSPSMRQMVSYTLEKAGYEVLIACDGQEALGIAEKNNVNLVLTDDGIKPTFGFVTTEVTSEMLGKANDLGADFLIAKPFTPSSFKLKLDKYLN